MPNWCGNYVQIEGKTKDIIKCIEGMKGKCAVYKGEKSEEECKIVYTFNATLPVPKEIVELEYHLAGHKWQSNNWGTKWDSLCEAAYQLDEGLEMAKSKGEDEVVKVSFAMNTAWSPPFGWFIELSEQNPDLLMVLHYEECGCELYGTVIANGGLVSEVNYSGEAEYVYYVDCDGCRLDDLVSIMIDRHDWHDTEEEFIEGISEALSFIWDKLDDSLKEKIKITAKEMYKE